MLILIRGLPGSGKTKIARTFDSEIFEADDYFMKDGVYSFDASKLAQAHQFCQENVRRKLNRYSEVIVSNTFTQRWEMEPYFEIAADADCRVTVLSLFDAGLTDEELSARNVHGVPVSAISRMRARFEHDWRNANPLAPWDR